MRCSRGVEPVQMRSDGMPSSEADPTRPRGSYRFLTTYQACDFSEAIFA